MEGHDCAGGDAVRVLGGGGGRPARPRRAELPALQTTSSCPRRENAATKHSKFKMVKGGRGGSKKKATSRSAKAGLQFPVGRVHRHIKLGCREEAAAAPRT